MINGSTVTVLTLLASGGIASALRETPLPLHAQALQLGYLPDNQTLTTCSPEYKQEAELFLQEQQHRVELQLQRQVTPCVTPKFIASRIVGGIEARRTELAKTIQQAKTIHPVIEDYIDLALTHLPDFAVTIHPHHEIRKKFNIDSGYDSAFQAMLLTDKPIRGDNELLLVVHECRHAAMNAVWRALDNPKSESSLNYFPKSDKKRVEKMFEKGDARAQALIDGKTKTADKKGQLKAKQQALQNYQEFYQVNSHIPLPNYFVGMIEEKIGEKLTPGLIINIDGYKINGAEIPSLPKMGDIRINSLQNEGQHVTIKFTFLDPLYGAAHQIAHDIGHVRATYKDDKYLIERDAYLFQKVPIDLIQCFYPELFQYTTDLIQSAREVAVLRRNKVPVWKSLEKMSLEHAATRINDMEDFFDVKKIDVYLDSASYLRKRGEMELAKKGLQELIKRGHKVGEANLELARIEYQEKNYPAAATYFKRADKRKVGLTKEDRLNYADALKQDRLEKPAAKQVKQALRLRP